MERTHHVEGLLIIILLIAIGAIYMLQNNQPDVTVAVPAATATEGDAPRAEWQIALEAQIAAASTPQSTLESEATPFVAPTLPPSPTAAAVVEPVLVPITPWPTPTARPAEPAVALSGATPFPSPTGIAQQEDNQTIGFQPPPEQVPLSAHADDHFWLVRPVDASANSASIFYYAFGSDGPTNEWRVHHGVDMPNPVGEKVHACGAGTVVFADNGGKVNSPKDIDIYASYGNVVVIEQDFGFHGQKIYTLYAHMTALLVTKGQHVEAGDVIGLSGATGDVSGPHVHLEVRLGEAKYYSVYNPLLWIAPYVGTGVIAGRITGFDGSLVDDVIVTVSQRGRVVETTSTYIRPKKPGQTRDWEVDSDPAWQENFVLGDIPEGEYEISVTLGGQRFAKSMTVAAGTTNFVKLGYEIAATPQPAS